MDELNAKQQEAVALGTAGACLFLTGPGGTGKSFALEHIVAAVQEAGRYVRVTASTGVAALNVKGCTIHSLLGTGIANREKEARKLAKSSYTVDNARYRLEMLDGIVIDEVSMLAGDYIDMLDWWLRRVLMSDELFGGKQIIFLGDFLQLPPVEKEVIYDAKFAFQSNAWGEALVKTIELDRSYRQNDQHMVDALNRIRYGEFDSEIADVFAPCVERKLKDPTRLCATNRAAQNTNMRKLVQLPGREHLYEGKSQGAGKYAAENAKRIEKNVIADKNLSLKEGAPVIMLVNDRERGFVNGSRARVAECGENRIVAELEDTGNKVEVGRHMWEMVDGSDRVVATFKQFPMKLAWAITIHKSQGMSLDRVALNLGDVFEKGQAYVALSRARSIEGLSLDAPLTERMIFAHSDIVDFYRRNGR